MPQATALGGVGILPPALDELLRDIAVATRRSAHRARLLGGLREGG
jgi:hypothetical protein